MSRVPRDWVLAAGDAYEEASGRDDWLLTDIEAALAAVAPLIRRAALEEAAKVCDSRYMGDNNREDMEARRCAAAIRALDT
jgi:hypothetical protein